MLRRALQLDLPLIVVDDGSTDASFRIPEAVAGLTLIRHPVNRGKGAALRTGFAAALEQGCDWAVTLDGDGQHRPEDVPALLAEATRGGRRIVVGRRLGMAGRNVPWTSRFGRSFSNFWVWAAGGPLISDSQSGFRCYPLPESLQLGVRASRYQFEVEILVRARRRGIDTVEVPVEVVYQGDRVSHFRPWLDFWRNSATFSRLICSRIFGGYRR